MFEDGLEIEENEANNNIEIHYLSDFQIEDFPKINTTVQYSKIYHDRLNVLKPIIIKKAKEIWGNECQYVEYSGQCKEMSKEDNYSQVIVGIIFKSMKDKPILTNCIKTYKSVFNTPHYSRKDDIVFVDDKISRMKTSLNPDNCVHGIVIGLKGKMLKRIFEVEDICYPQLSNIHLRNEFPEKDIFIAFLSGLEIGKISNLDLTYLQQFLNGFDANPWISKVSKIIFCGNSMEQPNQLEEVSRNSYRQKDINSYCYKNILTQIEELDQFFSSIKSKELIIMPGHRDMNSIIFPMPPLSKILFKKLNLNNNIELVENPVSFEICGLKFTGSSGENILDMMASTNNLSEIDCLKICIQSNLLFPTLPETLKCNPFAEFDPFLLKELPNIFFAGNCEKFDSSTYNSIKLITVPKYSVTKSIVLLNLKTLETKLVRLDAKI